MVEMAPCLRSDNQGCHRRHIPVVCAIIAVALFSGCGKAPPPIVEAEGIVRLDGAPLRNAEIRFFPTDDFGPEYVAKAVTDSAGRFKLMCKGQPGACAGENRVVVVEADLPAKLQGENAQLELAAYLRSLGGRPIPLQYGNLVDTPLKATVHAGQKEYAFDLTR